jgi:hypothetical protein
MTPSRAAKFAALLSAALLAGCTGSDPGSDAALGSPTPTVVAAVQWAGGVCSATVALQDSVQAVSTAVQIDPSAPAAALDQARAQVRERVGAVQASAASVRTALTGTPVEAGPELAAAQQQLQVASGQAQQGVERLGAAGRQLTQAQGPAEVATSLMALTAALGAATAGLAVYLDTLRAGIGGSGQAVRDTFTAAPECRDVVPPSPIIGT